MEPFWERLFFTLVGPVVSAVVGTLVVGSIAAWITRRAQDRRAQNDLRYDLVDRATEAASKLYFESQRYWRARDRGELGTAIDLAALRRDLDKQYHESRVIGQVLESRLAAHYPSGRPRLLWHRIIDLLTIRYFSLIEIATDNLRDLNAGPEHTGLTSDQLKNADVVLATYYETMALLSQAILTEQMSSVGQNPIKLPRAAQDLSPSPLVLELMAGKDGRPAGK